MMKQKATLLLIAVLVLVFSVGCVSNKKFDAAIADVTSRVDGVQGSVEANGEKISSLEKADTAIRGEVSKAAAAASKAQDASAAAMTKAEAAEKAARGKVIWQVTLTESDVRFGVDKTELEGSSEVLDALVAKLKGMDRMVFLEIQGHTDSTGSEKYNRVLGHKRAEAVQNYLHEKGIPLNLMSVISYGEARPVADNSSKDGRAANRRVEVLVLE